MFHLLFTKGATLEERLSTTTTQKLPTLFRERAAAPFMAPAMVPQVAAAVSCTTTNNLLYTMGLPLQQRR